MNKKLTSLLLSTSMVFCTPFTFCNNVQARQVNFKNTSQNMSINLNDFLNSFFKEDINIFWDKDDVPQSIKSQISKETLYSLWDVERFFNGNSDVFDFKGSKLSVKKVEKDNLGKKHYKAEYLVDKIPVYGSNLILHTNKNGKIYAINGNLDKDFENVNWHSKIKISSNQALQIAKNHIKPSEIFTQASKLYLYKFEGKTYVVYLVSLNCDTGDWRVFVNAENGHIVDKFNNRPILVENHNTRKDKKSNDLPKITGNGKNTTGIGKTTLNGNIKIPTYYENNKYYLSNKTKDMKGSINIYDLNNKLDEKSILRKNKSQIKQYGKLVSDDDNKFTDKSQVVAVDAYVNFSKVYDYYKNVLNRNSIDGKGMDIDGFVHLGNNYNNAFWFDSHKAMYFGDGDGRQFSNFTAALDVVAHELSHGITSMQSGLEYRKQSGALNEAFSDIMGAAVDDDDWQIGEDCYTPGIPGDALRDMKDPHKGSQPAHMNEYKDWPATDRYDWGGVHTNSGIINHAAYYIGESLGRKTMAKLFYRANCVYWRETTDFKEARDGVEMAAKDLFGENSKELKAVQKAFDNVGIKSSKSETTSTNKSDWQYENISLQSPHPYPNRYNNIKSYRKPGASNVALYFSKIALENRYDFIYIFDKYGRVISRLTGHQNNRWIVVPGDTAYIRIISDDYTNDYGYNINMAAYIMN